MEKLIRQHGSFTEEIFQMAMDWVYSDRYVGWNWDSQGTLDREPQGGIQQLNVRYGQGRSLLSIRSFHPYLCTFLTVCYPGNNFWKSFISFAVFPTALVHLDQSEFRLKDHRTTGLGPSTFTWSQFIMFLEWSQGIFITDQDRLYWALWKFQSFV